jgi:hypothetical protein
MTGRTSKADSVDENFLNHVMWYSATDSKRPYPGESEIKTPASFLKVATREVPDTDD